MKIGILIHTFYPAISAGGPVYSTINTCHKLSEIGVKIYISTSDLNCTKKLNIKQNSWFKYRNNIFIKYYSEKIIGRFSLSLRQILFLWKDIKDVDVVHIQGIFNTILPIGLFYAYKFNKPIVLSPRGAFGEWCLQGGRKFKKTWLKLFISPVANKITWHSTSSQECNEIQKLYPLAKVIIIPNGINYEEYSNIAHLSKNKFMLKFSNMDLSPSKIIISMGRIQKKKGFDILIKAFNNMLKEHPLAVLLIAGDEENKKEKEKENLEKLILKYQLEKNVFFIGMIEGQEKFEFFANADLFVLPSHNENFGNVYAESLAAGTPILASTNTPWEDVGNARCGKWVPNTIKDTEVAMIELLEKNRDELRVNSKNYIRKFDWKNIAREFKSIYKGLI